MTSATADPRVSVLRRIPSGLDVAFAAFGNDAVTSVLDERMAGTGIAAPVREGFQSTPLPFRDGQAYAPALLDMRARCDAFTATDAAAPPNAAPRAASDDRWDSSVWFLQLFLPSPRVM